MKKLATLIALIGLAGGAQAATQTAGAFTFSYDDSVMQFSSVDSYDSINVVSVWDVATNQSYAANFRTYYGAIHFTESSKLVGPSVDASFATGVGISSTENLNINQSWYNGPSEGFIETGSGVVSASMVGAYSGPGILPGSTYTNTWRNETVNIEGIGRAGNFNSYASIYFQCTQGPCTIADYTNGLNTKALTLDLTETVAVNAPFGDLAAYQRGGTSQVYAYAYEFVGYAGTPPVPEPDTYAMLLAGLGLMGSIARRRKQAGRGVGRR